MKKRRIKVLYAWLTLIMALLIALTGTFVPEFMLDVKADRLATQTGKVEMGMYRHIPIRWTRRKDCQNWRHLRSR